MLMHVIVFIQSLSFGVNQNNERQVTCWFHCSHVNNGIIWQRLYQHKILNEPAIEIINKEKRTPVQDEAFKRVITKKSSKLQPKKLSNEEAKRAKS